MNARIGEILVQKNLVSAADIEVAVAEQTKTGKLIGEILVQKGLVTERDLLISLGEQLQLDFVDLKKTKIMPEAVAAVPVKLANYYKIMPVEIKGSILTVAVSDPASHWPLDDIEVNLGLHPRMVLAAKQDIQEAIRQYYGVGAETVARIMKREEGAAAKKTAVPEDEPTEIIEEDVSATGNDATVVRLVDQILQEAVRRKATDIHVEMGRQLLAVRYRVDGLLADARLPDGIRYLSSAIVSRVKIMAGMDIVERRLPQDGRCRMKIGMEEFDLRISILPSRHGEDIALRLLPARTSFLLEALGMRAAQMEVFKKLIQSPHGILFVTGPTGSGKSTTLYTGLSQLNARDRKIITVEDPVEYEIPGISQIQVNQAIGLSFARILRNILRHDPDVIMVGEVRDAETAAIAVQAALTGHLVFSTLHTNDAASGVTRLVDMGIEPFLIASSVVAFVAQRLARVICAECKAEPTKEELHYYQKVLGDKLGGATQNLRRGRGCNACDFTGYRGRTALYEIMPIDEEIQRLILKGAAAGEIKKAAIQQGRQTLWDDGREKIIAGLTTPDEVMRVVG
ncbi:MAG: type II/IV secretion system protein [Deltaproteobacteria bacterium]|nr:type II/IV secretion system protein [Deltaproteobacteria bacterium]